MASTLILDELCAVSLQRLTASLEADTNDKNGVAAFLQTTTTTPLQEVLSVARIKPWCVLMQVQSCGTKRAMLDRIQARNAELVAAEQEFEHEGQGDEEGEEDQNGELGEPEEGGQVGPDAGDQQPEGSSSSLRRRSSNRPLLKSALPTSRRRPLLRLPLRWAESPKT